MELLAAIPFIALIAMTAWQLVVAGHMWWRVSETTRVAAREAYVGEARGGRLLGERRARQVAHSLLGSRKPKVTFGAGGEVRLSASVPLVQPFAAVLGSSHAPRISAESRLLK